MTGHDLPSSAWYASFYEDHENLADLWRWLRDKGREPDDVVRFLEEPWHFQPEWDEMVAEATA